MRVIVLALIACLPAAAASGTFSEGPLVVVLDNGHDADCAEEMTGLCAASVSGEDPGSLEVDLNQQIRFIGLAVEAAYVNDLLTYELLPDRTFTFDAAKLETEHGVFRLLVERVGNRSAPAPLNDFGVILAPQGFAVTWYGPTPFRPSDDPGRNGVYIIDIQEPGKGGLEYERVSGYHELGDTDTDARVAELTEMPCRLPGVETCIEGSEGLASEYRAASPNVTIGFAIHEASAGDSADALQRGEPLGPRGTAPPLPPRGSPPAPAAAPLSFPPGREGLPEAGAHVAAPARWTEGGTGSGGPPSSPPPSVGVVRADVPFTPPLAFVATIGVGLAFVAAVLYSRITRDGALQSERRARILAALETGGPQGVRALGRALGVDHTTVEHHVRVLRRLGHVTILREDRSVLVGLPGQEVPIREAAPHTAQALLLDVLRRHGGVLSRRSLHQVVTDIPARTRNHALLCLVKRGTVTREWDGAREVVKLST